MPDLFETIEVLVKYSFMTVLHAFLYFNNMYLKGHYCSLWCYFESLSFKMPYLGGCDTGLFEGGTLLGGKGKRLSKAQKCHSDRREESVR